MDNSEKTNTNFLSQEPPTTASVNAAEDETVSVNIDLKNEASLSGSVLRKDEESSTEIIPNKDGAFVSETVQNKYGSPLAESLPNKDETPSSNGTDIDEEVSLSQSMQNKDEAFHSEDMELSEDRASLSEDVNEDWAYLSEGEPNMDEAPFPDDIYIVDEASPSESMDLNDHEESLTENMPNKDEIPFVESIRNEDEASPSESMELSDRVALTENMPNKDETPLIMSTTNMDKVPIAQRITNEDEARFDEGMPNKNGEPLVGSVPNQNGAPLAEGISNGDEAPIVQSIEKEDEVPIVEVISNQDGTPLVESVPKKDEASSSDDIEIVEEISFSNKKQNKDGETIDLSEDGESISGDKDKGAFPKQSSDTAHHSDSSKLTKNQRKKRNKLMKKELRKDANLMQPMANQVHPKNYNPAEVFPKAQFSVTAKVVKRLDGKKWLSICVAVVKEGFPAAKLSRQEADLINMEILQLVDAKATLSNVLPIICRTSLNPQGALMVICRGGPTVQWLKKHFHYNNTLIPNAVLQILPNGLLPKLAKVAFKTRDVFTEDRRVFLNRLQRFNPHLHCEDWRILARTVEPKSARYIFEVNLESCEAIRRANFKAFTGLDKGFFKFLSDPYAIPIRPPPPKNQP